MAETITFECASCGKSLTVAAENVSRRGKCKYCKAINTVPAVVRPAAVPQPTAPTPQPQPAGQTVIVQAPTAGRGQTGLGIASLVLGILAVLICWIPFLGMGAYVLGGIGFLLGAIGLILTLTQRARGIGMNIAGLALCVVAMGITTIITVGMVAAIDSAVQAADSVQTQSQATMPLPDPSQQDASQPGRSLFAKHHDLVVREAASESASALITVDAGHELIEVSRANGWVEVGVARTGKVGWVSISSTMLTQAFGGTQTPETDSFVRFTVAFSILNQSVKSQTGIALFSDAEDMGDGIICVTATSAWLSGSADEQASTLNTVYELWRAADGSGFPVAVYVRGAAGNTVMTKQGS